MNVCVCVCCVCVCVGGWVWVRVWLRRFVGCGYAERCASCYSVNAPPHQLRYPMFFVKLSLYLYATKRVVVIVNCTVQNKLTINALYYCCFYHGLTSQCSLAHLNSDASFVDPADWVLRFRNSTKWVSLILHCCDIDITCRNEFCSSIYFAAFFKPGREDAVR